VKDLYQNMVKMTVYMTRY